MADTIIPSGTDEHLANLPEELPILPLRNTVAYPFSVLPLVIAIPRSLRLIEEALQGDRRIGLVSMTDGSIEEPQPGQIYETGTLAVIKHVVQGPDKHLHVVVHGLERFHIDHWLAGENFLRARINLAPDLVEPGLELDALLHSLRELAKEVAELSPNLPDEIGKFLDQVKDPRYLSYLVASDAGLDTKAGQEILEATDVRTKMQLLISHLAREKEVLTLGRKIKTDAREGNGQGAKGVLSTAATQGHPEGAG